MNKRFGLVFVISMVLGGCSAPLADFNSGDGGSNADAAVVPVGDASGSCTMVPGACGVGNRCDNGRCVAGCSADGDCNSGQVCNTSTRTCAVSDGGVVSDASVCGEGQTRCNGACVNCQTDAMHCGTCGRVCGAGQSCVAGACTGGNPGCGDGQTTCGGACVNTQANNMHCGGCGRTCNAGQSCVAGVCTGGSPTCTGSGQMMCGGVCVNTYTDVANCGTCGRSCASGQSCAAGVCTGGMMPPPSDAGAGREPLRLTVTIVDAGAVPNSCGASARVTVWGFGATQVGPVPSPLNADLRVPGPWRGYVRMNTVCGADSYNVSWPASGTVINALRAEVTYSDGSTGTLPIRSCLDPNSGTTKPTIHLDGTPAC